MNEKEAFDFMKNGVDEALEHVTKTVRDTFPNNPSDFGAIFLIGGENEEGGGTMHTVMIGNLMSIVRGLSTTKEKNNDKQTTLLSAIFNIISLAISTGNQELAMSLANNLFVYMKETKDDGSGVIVKEVSGSDGNDEENKKKNIDTLNELINKLKNKN